MTLATIAPPGTQPGTKRIILVDDEELVAYWLSRGLHGDPGVEIDTATTGEQALAALDRRNYDLCFLDLRLPGMDGLQTLAEIRRQFPAMKVVVMTASALTTEDAELVHQSADYVLPKPFDLRLARDLARTALAT